MAAEMAGAVCQRESTNRGSDSSLVGRPAPAHALRKVLKLIWLWLALTMAVASQNAAVSPAPSTDLVQRAFAAEVRGLQDTGHPMRYHLRKSSPHLTTTKEIVETQDGPVAMLLTVNDGPPSEADARKERERLDDLLADPGKQRHRKQGQDQDVQRVMKALRVMPAAFVYQYAGTVPAASGSAVRFTFTPNPSFIPPDLETEVLTAMSGEIWVDPVQVRVIHLQAKVERDVDFGWGVLGRLYKGGWLNIDTADIGGGVWRVVRFQMNMSARVLIRTKEFETVEEESHFSPVPPSLDYRQAIGLLRAGPAAGPTAGR